MTHVSGPVPVHFHRPGKNMCIARDTGQSPQKLGRAADVSCHNDYLAVTHTHEQMDWTWTWTKQDLMRAWLAGKTWLRGHDE